jgi:DNA transformation protein
VQIKKGHRKVNLPKKSMSKLIHLPNIDKNLEHRLLKVGITSAETLRIKGSRNVFFQLKTTDSSVCFETLLALEGAIRGILVDELKPETKLELKAFMEIFNR